MEPNDSTLSLAGYVATGVAMLAALFAIRIFFPDFLIPVVIAWFVGAFFTLFSFRVAEGYWPLNTPIHPEEDDLTLEPDAERRQHHR